MYLIYERNITKHNIKNFSSVQFTPMVPLLGLLSPDSFSLSLSVVSQYCRGDRRNEIMEKEERRVYPPLPFIVHSKGFPLPHDTRRLPESPNVIALTYTH